MATDVKSINIKKIKRITFINDMINIKVFDSNLLKIDKKSYKNIYIYLRWIRHNKKKSMVMKIFTV